MTPEERRSRIAARFKLRGAVRDALGLGLRGDEIAALVADEYAMQAWRVGYEKGADDVVDRMLREAASS